VDRKRVDALPQGLREGVVDETVALDQRLAFEDLGEATVKAEKHSGSRRIRRADGSIEGSQTELQLGLGIREQDLKVEGSINLSSVIELLERSVPDVPRPPPS